MLEAQSCTNVLWGRSYDPRLLDRVKFYYILRVRLYFLLESKFKLIENNEFKLNSI